jgi:hypothetical protein
MNKLYTRRNNMKKLVIISTLVLVIFGFKGTAMAYTSYSSPIAAKDMWMSYAGGSSTDTFTLKLNAFEPGKISVCSSARLILSFAGDANPFHIYEFAGITESSKNTIFEVKDGSTMVIPISKDGLISLNSTGQLAFTLTRYCGDFTFKTAKLTADCITDTVTPPVPIPAALWLFGTTLIGFLAMKRQLVQI